MIHYKWRIQIAAAALLLSSMTVMAKQNKQAREGAERSNPPLNANQALKSSAQESSQDDGEQVFQQHCSRCHTAPDGFSSRISGTVAMHMRVRASLSEREMKALLRFLNP